MATSKNNTKKPSQANSKKSKPKKKSPKKAVKKFSFNNLAIGVFLIILGLFSAYAYIDFNAGMVGDFVSQAFSYCFGAVTLFMSIYIFTLGVLISMNKIEDWSGTFVLVFLLFVNMMIGFSINTPNLMDYSIPELFSLAQYGQYGGIIGILLAVLFIKLFAVKGTFLLIFVSSAIILIFIFRNSLKKYWDRIKDKNENAPPLKDRLKNRIDIIRDKQKIKQEVKATKERTSETTMIPLVSDHDDNSPLFEPFQINESANKPIFEPVTGVIPAAKK
ncbi:MAG: DNA translocase FtsK 4TM domain-containing protein [Acetobacterium sp.]|nr:DNA translocase FtsK 4TM domain-containing protein [Acetobacterium sp.]